MLTRPDTSHARVSKNKCRNPCYSIIAPTLLTRQRASAMPRAKIELLNVIGSEFVLIF